MLSKLKKYVFIITAVLILNPSFASALLPSLPSILSAPSNLAASINGNTATLSWKSVLGATGYKLYYGYSSMNYIGSVDLGNVTSQVFPNLPDSIYYLALEAYAGVLGTSILTSAKSSEITVIIPGPVVTTISSLNFTSLVSANSVTLKWDSPIAGASGYELHYGLTSGNYTGNFDLGKVNLQSYSNVANGTYYLKIKPYTSILGKKIYHDATNELVVIVGGP